MNPADLAKDTAVEPVAKVAGLYVSDLPPSWSYVHPCGGVLMTTALRAMRHAIDDASLDVLSATTLFCQPVQPGRLHVKVEVLRHGDSAAQARASLTNPAQPGPGLEVVATFARERSGPDVHGVTMPEVPGPGQALATAGRTLDPEKAPWAFYRNVEMAIALGEPMWRPGWSKGPAHVAFWYRYRVPQRTPEGHLDPLALPPIADSMPPALTRLLGPDHERFLMPSLDLTVFFLERPASDWILVESFVERARGGYAVGSANLWDERGQLVARAAQSMTLRQLRMPGH